MLKNKILQERKDIKSPEQPHTLPPGVTPETAELIQKVTDKIKYTGADDEKAPQQIRKQINPFLTETGDIKYDSVSPHTSLVVTVAGEPETGKSHYTQTWTCGKNLDAIKLAKQNMSQGEFLLNFQTPVADNFVADTEGRANVVMAKFGNRKRKVVKTWDDIENFVDAIILKHLSSDGSIRTITIDNATPLVEYSIIKYINDHKKRPAPPGSTAAGLQWGEIFGRVRDLIKKCRDNNFNLILPIRVKDEFLGDVKTGEKVPAQWKDLPYESNICLELCYGVQVDGELYCKHRRFAKIIKADAVEAHAPYLFDVSMRGTINVYYDDWKDKDIKIETLKKLLEFLKSLPNPFQADLDEIKRVERVLSQK